MAKRKDANPADDAVALSLTAPQWKFLADPKRSLPPAWAARFAEPYQLPLPCGFAELEALYAVLHDEMDNSGNQRSEGRLAVLLDRLEAVLHGHVHLAPHRPRSVQPAKPDPRRVFEVVVMLVDVTPMVWRRLQVADCTLAKFHDHLQAAMGWTNSHLHVFRVGQHRYGVSAHLDDPEVFESSTATLSTLCPDPARRRSLRYEYDFGDGWLHAIMLERSFAPAPGAKYPACVDGGGNCPPEDVGGPYGYQDFKKAMANPKHPEHRDFKEWIGGKFDPAAFSAEAVNKRMRKR